nr:TIGR01244 family phosphatase [Rhizobium sp. Q54]
MTSLHVRLNGKDKQAPLIAMPKLILHALQVNLRCGRPPWKEGIGRRNLKIP